MYSIGLRHWIIRSKPVVVSWLAWLLGTKIDLIIVLLIDSSVGGNSMSMKDLGTSFLGGISG